MGIIDELNDITAKAGLPKKRHGLFGVDPQKEAEMFYTEADRKLDEQYLEEFKKQNEEYAKELNEELTQDEEINDSENER